MKASAFSAAMLAAVIGSVCFADIAQAQESVLYSFSGSLDGSGPSANLIAVKGVLYGTTLYGGGHTGCGEDNGCGTVFAFDLKTGTEKVLYSFCSLQNCADGARPTSGLVDVKGKLYGVTGDGGANCKKHGGCGVVFALDPNSGVETAVYSFCVLENCADGGYPYGNLIDINGTLYGATTSGPSKSGNVYALDPDTGAESVLYTFRGWPDGKDPDGGLMDLNGMLYGTTFRGGKNCRPYVHGCGAVFVVDPANDTEQVVYSFCSQHYCADGENPDGSLIAANGMIYGMTVGGGNDTASCEYVGCGTVFVFNPTDSSESVLYAFCVQQSCADGLFPQGNLINVSGKLYGVTYSGGGDTGCGDDYGCGTAFVLDPKTGVENVLYSFCSQQNCADGANPAASLIDSKDMLYGTSLYGGAYGQGVLFGLKR